MALWQFKVELIPSAWAQAHDVALLFNEEGCDPSTAWKGFERIEPLCQGLDSVLPRGRSWHLGQSLWGSEDQSDIQLWRENGEIESLSARFDLRQSVPELFLAVAKFTAQFQLAILSVESLQYIQPTQEALLTEASCSRAAEYAKNPAEFIATLARKGGAT